MPILNKCSDCERVGGYSENETDKICMRCKNNRQNLRTQKKDPTKEEDKFA